MNDDFKVTEGLRIPREVVAKLVGHDDHVNGVVIKVSKALREHPGVEPVDLTEAASKLHAQ